MRGLVRDGAMLSPWREIQKVCGARARHSVSARATACSGCGGPRVPDEPVARGEIVSEENTEGADAGSVATTLAAGRSNVDLGCLR